MDAQDVAYCHHCGNYTPQQLIGTCCSGYGTADMTLYLLTQCQTCAAGQLYRREQATPAMLGTSHGRLDLSKFFPVWPRPSDLHTCVPEKIRNVYNEAASIKSRAPNAFANQIRRAIEAICRDQGASKNNLAASLKQLAENGKIPDQLAGMTDILRQLGNTGSHAGDQSVEPEYVDAIDDFFRTVVEYLYVAPHKMSQIQVKLDLANTKRAAGS